MVRREVHIQTNIKPGLLKRSLPTTFNDIRIKIHQFSYKKTVTHFIIYLLSILNDDESWHGFHSVFRSKILETEKEKSLVTAWHLKSPAMRLFVEQNVQANNKDLKTQQYWLFQVWLKQADRLIVIGPIFVGFCLGCTLPHGHTYSQCVK